jgi:hypothetical protein
VKAVLHELGREPLTHEFIDLILDEAERALLDVEARTDEPDRRIALEQEADGVADLRLAIAELADQFPGIHYDLESIGERLRNVGAIAAATELEVYPHVTQLVRLSLEVFFRIYPTDETYESEYQPVEDSPEEEPSAFELYEAYGQLLAILRESLS